MLDVLWADSPQLSSQGLGWSWFKKDSSPKAVPSSWGCLHPMMQEYKGPTCYADLGQCFKVSQEVGWGLHSYCTIAHLFPLFNPASFLLFHRCWLLINCLHTNLHLRVCFSEPKPVTCSIILATANWYTYIFNPNYWFAQLAFYKKFYMCTSSTNHSIQNTKSIWKLMSIWFFPKQKVNINSYE